MRKLVNRIIEDGGTSVVDWLNKGDALSIQVTGKYGRTLRLPAEAIIHSSPLGFDIEVRTKKPIHKTMSIIPGVTVWRKGKLVMVSKYRPLGAIVPSVLQVDDSISILLEIE